MTAVIYARYSSDNQREESIEGQIRECTAYAEKNGITIVKHYDDKVLITFNYKEGTQTVTFGELHQRKMVRIWIAFLHHKEDSF